MNPGFTNLTRQEWKSDVIFLQEGILLKIGILFARILLYKTPMKSYTLISCFILFGFFINPVYAQEPAPPVSPSPSLDTKVKTLFCIFNKTKGWSTQLKNISKEDIVIDTLGISMRDIHDKEVARGGTRKVAIKAGDVIFLKGEINKTKDINWSKITKAVVILNPNKPDTYFE